MSNLIEIVKAYANKVIQPEDMKEIAESRAEICAACPLLTPRRNCSKKQGGCGCWIPAKVWGRTSKCPKNKWKN